jgi:hypothetical protein
MAFLTIAMLLSVARICPLVVAFCAAVRPWCDLAASFSQLMCVHDCVSLLGRADDRVLRAPPEPCCWAALSDILMLMSVSFGVLSSVRHTADMLTSSGGPWARGSAALASRRTECVDYSAYGAFAID